MPVEDLTTHRNIKNIEGAALNTMYRQIPPLRLTAQPIQHELHNPGPPVSLSLLMCIAEGDHTGLFVYGIHCLTYKL